MVQRETRFEANRTIYIYIPNLNINKILNKHI